MTLNEAEFQASDSNVIPFLVCQTLVLFLMRSHRKVCQHDQFIGGDYENRLKQEMQQN